LKDLDLSFNQLRIINVHIFLNVINLKVLSLANNPLALVQKGESPLKQRSLVRLDLSFTNLQDFSSDVLSHFPFVQTLNLSHTKLRSIGLGGFRHLPMLTVLDLSASAVQTFPEDVFSDLTRLQRVVTDNYKLCCPDVLPDGFKERNCLAPRSELSSCKDLLRSEGYRVGLWYICVCAVTGNLLCLAFRFRMLRQSSKSAFNKFVSSLSIADFLMGVYVATIGAADVTFKGGYARHEYSWLHSAPCKVAGFLSLLSSEVSALIIFLITLDRFLVLRFPFSTARFGNRSASIACIITWSLGFLLAAVPLLPVTSHWQFYSQTGICIPLPVTRQDFEGRGYATACSLSSTLCCSC
jgi:hypothetical protein